MLNFMRKYKFIILMKYFSFITMLLYIFNSLRYLIRNMYFEAICYFISSILWGVAIPLWIRREKDNKK